MDGRIGINDRIVAVNCVNLTRATRQEVCGIQFLYLSNRALFPCLHSLITSGAGRIFESYEIQQLGKRNFFLIYSRSELNERMNNTVWCI